jgi:integrase
MLQNSEDGMTAKSTAVQPINRGGVWYLTRRVPKKFAHIEKRKHVNISTGLAIWADPHGIRAKIIATERYNQLLRHWQNKLVGGHTPEPEHYFAAKKRAEALGLVYMTGQELVELDPNELNHRVQILKSLWASNIVSGKEITPSMRADFDAVLGGIPAPDDGIAPADNIMLSEMINEYERINAHLLKKKSPNQLRRWRVARQSNLDIFIATVGGDRPITSLTRKHTLAYRSYWMSRIESGDVRVNSANRTIRQVSGLYSTIRNYHQIGGPPVFDKLFIRGGEEGKRLTFAPAFVQSRFLADGTFDRLNPEVRRIIYLIIETGLRLSEACALDRTTIILDAPIPYVDIKQVNRVTKTMQSVRQVPLVGVALMAMQRQPNGFPRYVDKAESASALINKALYVRNLRPLGKLQTLYSMRHTLVDRLTAIDAPEIIKEDILGHKHMYGHGTTLEQRHRWLQRIAFDPPSRV